MYDYIDNIYQIEKNIFIADLALFLKHFNTLIISDLHIGYEEKRVFYSQISKKGYS